MNPEEEDDAKRHLKWENSKAVLLDEIRQYEARLDGVRTQAGKTPRHITWSELPEGRKFKKLATSRKRLAETVQKLRAQSVIGVMAYSEGIYDDVNKSLYYLDRERSL
jgi:hypothetical protein